MGRNGKSLFNHVLEPEPGSHPNLYSWTFLTPEHYGESSASERDEEIRKQWDEFLDRNLPA